MAAAVVSLVSITANAQIGVKAGYLSTKFSEKYDGHTYKSRPMNGFEIGVDYDIRIARSGFSVRPGVFYNYFGKSTKDQGFTSKERYHFLNVPVDFKYEFRLGDEWGIYAVAGPKLVIGMAGKNIYEGDGDKETINVFTGKYEYDVEGDVEKGDESAFLNRPDVQIGVGLGVEYDRISLEFGYDWGLMNILKHADDATIKRNQLGITLGYTF